MNWKKIFTIAALTVFSASVATGQGTAPTIVQGDYISNVFGQSNFIKNPNAKLNTKDVTVSNATVLRSIATSLVATSEFTITTSTATGYADWATRTFDAGMKGQNCEARFTYRGFSVGTTKAQLIQNSLVVAELTLTASTDPRIASINFPCGDLANATTFRLQQSSASLTGTNEIGGIYVGLATNQANVAQAEFVGGYTVTNVTANPRTTSATMAALTGGNFAATLNGKATSYDAASGSVTFSYLPAGTYQVIFGSVFFQTASSTSCRASIQETTSNLYRSNSFQTYSTVEANAPQVGTAMFDFSTGAARTFRVVGQRAGGTGECTLEMAAQGIFATFSVYRFPTSSELVVKPETQNVWGAVEYRSSTQSLFSGTADPTAYTEFNNATWNQPTLLKGKAEVTTTNSGNDLGFSIPNLPVGSYKLEITGRILANAGTTLDNETVCTFRIRETTTSTTVAENAHQSGRATTGGVNTTNLVQAFQGIFKNTSVATRNFRLEASKTFDSNATNTGICQASAEAAGTQSANIISFTLTPLDQPSNSALYVEGPVRGAQTGAAISAGYVGETIVAENNAFVQTGMTNSTTVAFLNITLTPGVWLISASQTVVQNGSTGTAFSSTLSDVSTSGNTVTGIGLSVTDNNGWPPNNVTGLTITHPSFIYSTATSKTIYLNSFALFTAGTPSRKGTLRAIRLN